MTGDRDHGFAAPVHRALTQPMLLAGAPRAIALVNGTLAAALGLGLRLWLVGLGVWLVGHGLAVWAARHDPLVFEVGRRHVRIPARLEV
ncbi:conjugal transfer protein [Caulobacter sp. Root656]|jgi:type IV secretion system protein VirB3|uniref:VirB3 family type IV secretion system protein n=1 Tax=Caulobacter sp. Root1472 TaxID=1736470 RepID=UPI0006FF3FEF|nr:VirB3 family type IV secretion system protein [Caulobacter sp. Root1472]KQZ29039.1 conjugal transfer protein [Caulobacter sp. Root1472]KRA66982.1 conjugal transfer protein [Caulobacter sp. Root656]